MADTATEKAAKQAARAAEQEAKDAVEKATAQAETAEAIRTATEDGPDERGFVLIHHPKTKGEARVHPRAVKHYEGKGWKTGRLPGNK